MNRRGFLGKLVSGGLALAGLGAVAAALPKPVINKTARTFTTITLHPKKLACLIKAPNELTQMGQVVTDWVFQDVQDDLLMKFVQKEV